MKKLIIFEDGELDFTKEIIGSNLFDILFIRINGFGRFSNEYINFISEKYDVFYIDVYIDFKITIDLFKSIYHQFLSEEEIFFINLSEKGQYLAQKFANQLDLKGCVLEENLVSVTKDKLLMKDFLKNNSINTTEYNPLYNSTSLCKYDNNYLIKIRNSDSCRGIYNIENIRNKKFNYSLGYLIEKKINFTKYSEYAVDIIIYNGKIINYFVTKYPNPLITTLSSNNVINGNISLRHLDSKMNYSIKNVIELLIDSLKVNMGFIHMEFFYDYKKDHLIVSEFGYRLAGGRMIQNHETGFGISFSQIFIDMVLGNEDALLRSNVFSRDVYVGDLYLPITKNGKVKSFTNIKSLNIDGVKNIDYYYSIGDDIKIKEKTSFNSFGKVVIEGKTEQEVYTKMKEINKKFFVEVE